MQQLPFKITKSQSYVSQHEEAPVILTLHSVMSPQLAQWREQPHKHIYYECGQRLLCLVATQNTLQSCLAGLPFDSRTFS